MKFCKDCKFYDPTDLIGDKIKETTGVSPYTVNPYAKCLHIQAVIPDDGAAYERFMVTGEEENSPPQYKSCQRMRRRECGEDAKFFVPKE